MPSALLRLDRDQCHVLDDVLSREWLETDGVGGYASSTPLLCHTRRYHGLLITPPPGSPKRHVFLSRFEESLHEHDKSFPLSMARYRGVFAPLGHRSLDGFALVPFPRSVYKIGRNEISREILLVSGAPICLIRYRILTERDSLELRLRPLLAFREADALTFENLELNPRSSRITGGIRCQPYTSLPPLDLTIGGVEATFDADPVWYRSIEYPTDLRRGYDGHEDQFNPGVFKLRVRPGQDVVVAATVVGSPILDPVALWQTECARRQTEMKAVDDDPLAILRLESRVFLSRVPTTISAVSDSRAQLADGTAPTRLAVVAGYHWFGEWGRDAFIALPGLTLERGDAQGVADCRDVLLGALPFLKDGLLPNVFGSDRNDSHYGSADAALWYALAVRRYMLAGAPLSEMHSVFLPALTAIAEGYLHGTGDAARALAIRCDSSGLLMAGSAATNATWMDAQVDHIPVTPRFGVVVELNALWYFLLQFLETLCADAEQAAAARHWRDRRLLAGQSFMSRLWLDDERYLADVWHDGCADRTVRPNMVIAAALEWSPLSRGKRTDIVLRTAAELLTPRGLRTLDPIDPGYRGHYHGNTVERDRAYHQGTVWPWLLGFYGEALLRALQPDVAQAGSNTASVESSRGNERDRDESHEAALIVQLRAVLAGFRTHLAEAGLGHVSEVFDGDPPHLAGGCIAQAWSTAELVRALAMLQRGEP